MPEKPAITVDEFMALAERALPLVGDFGIRIEGLEAGRAVLRLPAREGLLRPGGTISGPAMVALADVALYAAVLSLIGPVELAVTTNLNANFLRRPPPIDLIGEASMLKLGKRLAVGEVTIRAADRPEPVAHVTGTYSIPPRE